MTLSDASNNKHYILCLLFLSVWKMTVVNCWLMVIVDHGVAMSGKEQTKHVTMMCVFKSFTLVDG
jgi:hypothetical protein